MKAISPEHKKLGQRIKELRKERHITQEDLAEMADIDRSFVGFLERGERGAGLETLVKVAKSLRVKVRDLFSF